MSLKTNFENAILKFVKKFEEVYQSGHLQSNHYTNTVDKSRIVIDRVPIFPRFSIICDRNLINEKVIFKNSISLDDFLANVIAKCFCPRGQTSNPLPPCGQTGFFQKPPSPSLVHMVYRCRLSGILSKILKHTLNLR